MNTNFEEIDLLMEERFKNQELEEAKDEQDDDNDDEEELYFYQDSEAFGGGSTQYSANDFDFASSKRPSLKEIWDLPLDNNVDNTADIWMNHQPLSQPSVSSPPTSNPMMMMPQEHTHFPKGQPITVDELEASMRASAISRTSPPKIVLSLKEVEAELMRNRGIPPPQTATIMNDINAKSVRNHVVSNLPQSLNNLIDIKVESVGKRSGPNPPQKILNNVKAEPISRSRVNSTIPSSTAANDVKVKAGLVKKSANDVKDVKKQLQLQQGEPVKKDRIKSNSSISEAETAKEAKAVSISDASADAASRFQDFPPLNSDVQRQVPGDAAPIRQILQRPKEMIVPEQHQQQRPRSEDKRDGKASFQRPRLNNNENQQPSSRNIPKKDDGSLMTLYEKELIVKIQIAQLVCHDPYAEDFYYKVHSTMNAPEPGSAPSENNPRSWAQNMIKNNNRNTINVNNAIQSQMQRLIEGRKKAHPKGVSLSLEGALGKIALNSVKNPKQAIKLSKIVVGPLSTGNAGSSNKQMAAASTIVSQKKVLKTIEDVYTNVLDLEHLKRLFNGEAKDPDFNEDSKEYDVQERDAKWNTDYESVIKQLIENLQFTESYPLDIPHPITHFLHYAKGKRILPRAMKFLDAGLKEQFISTILTRLEGLDACHVPLGAPNTQADLFMQTVIPQLVGVITDVSLSVVNSFSRTIFERHPCMWLIKSKVGLSILTMLLSRAEISKAQNDEGGNAVEEDTVWVELYNFLFGSLQTNFASIFPSVDCEDETFVWHFLAALAVGATTPEHQHVLVSEVRDKLVRCSREGSENGVANVNLFLNALGLGIDASQLAQ